MDIILVHLGQPIPTYLLTCIQQIRKYSKDRIVLVLSELPMFHFVPNDNIAIISKDFLDETDNYKKFKETNHFSKKEYMGLSLWKCACERFFIIEMVMKYLGIEKALHIENDNLIYGKPHEIFLELYCGDSVGLSNISDQYLSAGIMYIGNTEALCEINNKLNGIMVMEESVLNKKYTKIMMNEMRMLKIINDENPGLIKLLPIFPSKESNYVYDCASWGQYVGGAFGHEGEPFSTDTHFIGKEINQGRYDVKWETKDNYKKPYVFDTVSEMMYPLYNLHIHSKNLERWVS